MLEKYLKLLDKLKEKKFSRDISLARQTIITTLKSDKFSTEARGYLSSMRSAELVLMSSLPNVDRLDDLPIGSNAAYVRVRNDALNTLFYVNKLTHECVEIRLSRDILARFDMDLQATAQAAMLSEANLSKITAITGHRSELGEPFTNFSHEPEQISQVKKIINALYHGELALIDAETVNLRDGVYRKTKDIYKLYSKTIHHTYLACYLATHLDIDLSDMFGQELAVLAPLVSTFQDYAETYGEETRGLLAEVELPKLPHTIGVWGGILVDQLNPQGGEVDYEFLTRFSAVLPGYLDQLSGYIEQFSSNVATYEPNINRADLEALQDNALQLLNALERTRGSSLFLPLKTLHYIHIIRHTITLSMSIFEQAGNLSDASQDAVRAKLAELKYTLLPALFGLSDKIEEQAMLTPGLLSHPLMERASRLYELLIGYTRKFVNFSEKGQELVTIEDPKFLRARLDHTYQRSADDHAALLKIEEARRASEQFFLLLRDPHYGGRRLVDLPATTKQLLTTYYKQIHPYVLQLNMPLNNAIISGLTKEKSYLATIAKYTIYPIWSVRSLRETDDISDLLKLRPVLDAHLEKIRTSHQFHLKLNDNIMASAAERMEKLHLFSYNPGFCCLVLMPTVPDDFNTLPLPANYNSYYVQVAGQNNALYYIDRTSKSIKKLPIPEEKKPGFNQVMLGVNKNELLSTNDFIKITSLTGHIHQGEDPFALNEANLLRLDLIAENNRLKTKPRPFTAAQSFTIATNEANMLRFEAATEHEQLQSLEHLTHAQTISLYQYYQIKCAKLERARKAYNEFHQILSAEGHPSLLKDYNSELKKKLRHLYGIFQPYVVSGLSLNLEADTVDVDTDVVRRLDRAIVTDLVVDTAMERPHRGASITAILARDVPIRARFGALKTRLDERHVVFANRVKALTRQEHEEKPLVQDRVQIARAHHVLRNEGYSMAISEFRASLYQLTLLFNDSVRAQLRRAETGLPFPELADTNQALAQSGQALGLKRLFNCLYHLEKISEKLEELTDQSLETTYVVNVAQIGVHLYDVINLTKALVATPYLSVVAGDMWEKLQKGYAMLQDVRRHYIPQPGENEEGELVDLAKDHAAVLFYTLNAMMVLPEHITALRQDQEITPERIHALHVNTEKVTADIERILRNSSSYFKLFLEIPTMYRLFYDLKGKLAKLATASHDVVMDNLEAINHELLTSMLLEADQWEDNLGLLPGTITATMKELFDAFYQGLLEPLGMTSQRHIALASSLLPIEQRILAARERIAQSELLQRETVEKQEIVQRLYLNIKFYREYHGAEAGFRARLRALMIDSFRTALPLLIEAKPHFGTDILGGGVVNQAIDALLNSSVESPPLTNIEAIAAATVSYFKGVQASYQLTLGTVQEKITYLNTLKVSQLELNAIFTENYTKACYKKQATAFAAKQVGLIHCSREYNRKLADYLQEAEPAIVLASKSAEDIDKRVVQLLRAKVKQFELDHYKNYYHLEALMAAIDRLRLYVHQSNIAVQMNRSTFESIETLSRKSQLVVTLEDLARDEAVPIAARLANLREFIEAPTFKTRIFAYHHYDNFSFAWLKQCVVSLLELIGLYTPEHRKCYNQLVGATEPPEGISQLATRFGLFSANAPLRAYDVPAPCDEPQLVPAVS